MKRITDAWPLSIKRDYGQPKYDDPAMLHQSPTFGPHICARCHGARWTRESTEEGNKITRCELCASEVTQADNRRLAELWHLSGLNPDATNAASLAVALAGQDDMFAVARTFAKRPTGWLTLYGTWGGGKSYVGEAITRYLLRKRIACLYMRAPDLFAYLGAVDRNPEAFTDYENRLYWIQRTTVLVIDEFNKEKQSDTVMKLRTSLLDYRWQRANSGDGGATVLISNDEPAQWQDKAITSRAQDVRFVVVEAPRVDYRRVAR